MSTQPKSFSPSNNNLPHSLINGAHNQIHQQQNHNHHHQHHQHHHHQQQPQTPPSLPGQSNASLSSSPEKPLHYTYLKGFRVEQCALFLQHKCTNHKPYTCFDWHFQNQRRRRPVRRRDGTFNYSPDTYCTKYDETTGICPDKDDCPFLHKTAGDTERRYHLRYYKTGICVYETDARGNCSKNGRHCAFAHGTQDLRSPVFDQREIQSLENGTSGSESHDNSSLLFGGATMDRERNALLEEPRWNETAYVLANYKTTLCKRPPRFCRQGYACPQFHNGKDRRRSPKVFKYRSTPCPNTKQGDEWVDPSKCEQGDQCPYCHSRTEQQFHPEIFKSTKCKDIQETGFCPRGAFCAFAHNDEEIVATRDIDLENVDPEGSKPIMSQSYPGESCFKNFQLNDSLRSTIESPLNDSMERMQPFGSSIDDNDDDDIFRSEDIRRVPDRTPTNNLGPIARPRSYSHSQAKTTNNDFNHLHQELALARARLIDEFKVQVFGVPNNTPNPIGFRERAVHSFSISSATDAVTPSLFNSSRVTALDFLPSSCLSNLNLGGSRGGLDLNHLVSSSPPANALSAPTKSLSPHSNSLSQSLIDGLQNQINPQPHPSLSGQDNGLLSSSPEKSLLIPDSERVTALDFLPTSCLSNLNLGGSKGGLDLNQLINNSQPQTNVMSTQPKSLSPSNNNLPHSLINGVQNHIHPQTPPSLPGQSNASLSSSPEKPLHYTYLKGFRVEQCALFLQHKCTNHKPYTCFDWHFQNQRRRRPVRRRDGTFNYSPDTYCTKYDETTGICPDKDDCPFLHKTAGDTERRYHLRYYKTGICVYETDARGNCSKNGRHCAFAHGTQDLRSPVFDQREIQSLENGTSGSESHDNSSLLFGGATMDRERNALLEEPRWNETAYVLANYKTTLCKRPPRFCRQGYACPQFHNGKDRRRSPKVFKYRSTPCPNTKQGDEWVDPSKCEQGDQCPYCHSRTEQQFHPEIFKSTKCKDIQETGFCPRGAFCAFAHNDEEIVATRDIDLEKVDAIDCSSLF